MKQLKFVHCSDLHIDTPFKGISETQPDLNKLLCESTYTAFNNIVDLAIKEKVDCVLIAGDVYDSEDKSLSAQLKFRDSLARLSKVGIQTFIAHGNHDPLNGWSATLEWPENVYTFPAKQVECVPIIRNDEIIANVFGISFAKRDIYDNLALKFPHPERTNINIGLLHTNIGTNTGHEPYAPCTVEELTNIGMDYWALGHIHNYHIFRQANPAIVYPGCSQSRNPRETGAKGCCLVTIKPPAEPDICFVPTDIVRYKSDYVDISACSLIDDVIESIIEKCKVIASESSGCHSIIRLSLIGRTELNSELQKENSLTGILENIREYFNEYIPLIWVEKLILNTAGTYDISMLRNGNDFIADIISIYDELENSQSPSWEEFRDVLKPVFSKWPGHSYLEELSNEELLTLAREARNRMLDKLIMD